MKRYRHRAVLPLGVVAVLVAASLSSCAYFNTLYNARKIYREAEKSEGKTGEERAQRDKYTEVVKKCSQMIQDYPKSRWVDDAEFLMGKALFKQGDYDKAIRKFQEILSNFPKSKYVPESVYWLAFAYHRKQENTQALAYTDRFLKEYPRHKLRDQVMFLAGDINRDLENYDAALQYYGTVAEGTKKKETIDEARIKSAELFRARGEWDKAAANYEKVLRKGIPWARRYEVTRSLGDCYARLEKCREALLLFSDGLKQTTVTQETLPLMLGQAESYVCMDSLSRAISIYNEVIKKGPRSLYSAEAYYRMGIVYHERLDSLQAAQVAFSKVGEESASYEFAGAALERSNSLKRLIDLRKKAGTGETTDQAAEKRFTAAEIQLTRLDNVPLALQGYTAVVDSFPQATLAPTAAFAIAWIYQRKLDDKEKAIEAYRVVAARYPRSPQAKGALIELGNLGAVELRDRMKAVVDSALADTLSSQPPSAVPQGPAASPADSAAALMQRIVTAPKDTSRAAVSRAVPPSAADTSRTALSRPARHGRPDTLQAAAPTRPDTSRGAARPPVPTARPDTGGVVAPRSTGSTLPDTAGTAPPRVPPPSMPDTAKGTPPTGSPPTLPDTAGGAPPRLPPPTVPDTTGAPKKGAQG